jgi:hypothetical protein
VRDVSFKRLGIAVAAVTAIAVLVAGCGGSDDSSMDPMLTGDWHLVRLTYAGYDQPIEWAKTLSIDSAGDFKTEWREHGLYSKDIGRLYVRSHDYQQVLWETTDPDPVDYMAGNQHDGTYTIEGDVLTITHELYNFADTEVVETYARGADRTMRDTKFVGRWLLKTRTVDGEPVDVNWEKTVQIDGDGDYYATWLEHGLKSHDVGLIRAFDGRYTIYITERDFPKEADVMKYLGPYLVTDTTMALAVLEADDKTTIETFERLP